jgi:hypothetical protein
MKKIIFISVCLSVFFCSNTAFAGAINQLGDPNSVYVPPVSNPEKVGCADDVQCGESYPRIYNGVIYDCICTCPGPDDDCTPISKPGTNPDPTPTNSPIDSHSSKPASQLVSYMVVPSTCAALGYLVGGADNQEKKDAKIGLAAGFFLMVMKEAGNNNFLPEPKHYVLAAQLFSNEPLFVYSLSLSDSKTISTIISISTGRPFSYTLAISERSKNTTENTIAVMFTYEF